MAFKISHSWIANILSLVFLFIISYLLILIFMTVIGSDRWRLPVRWIVLVDILGLAARPRTSTTPKAPFPSPLLPSLPLLHQSSSSYFLCWYFDLLVSCLMLLLSGLYVSLFRFSTVWCDSDFAYSFFFLSTSPTSIASKWSLTSMSDVLVFSCVSH